MAKATQNAYSWIVSTTFYNAPVEDQKRVFDDIIQMGLKYYKQNSVVSRLVENYYQLRQILGSMYSVYNTEALLGLNVDQVLAEVKDRELLGNDLGHKRNINMIRFANSWVDSINRVKKMIANNERIPKSEMAAAGLAIECVEVERKTACRMYEARFIR
jgi:hypothetical protein